MVITLFLFSSNNQLPNATESICWKSDKDLNKTSCLLLPFWLIGFYGNMDLYVSFNHSQKKKILCLVTQRVTEWNKWNVCDPGGWAISLRVSRGLMFWKNPCKTVLFIFGFLWPGRTRRIGSSRAKGNISILVCSLYCLVFAILYLLSTV